MFSMLKSGGRLVSITSVSWTTGTQKKQVAFREWLNNHGAVVFLNEAGAFKSSGTTVATATIILNYS
jgi:selenocysteine lyase/cysteine desulfurase